MPECFSGTPNAALLKLVWANSGVASAVNTFGVHNPGSIAITQALTNSVETAIKAAYTSSGLAAQHGTTWTLSTISLRGVVTQGQPEFVGAGAPVAGTATGIDLLPLQTSFCITLRTAFAGRQYRGRTYIPGYVETQNAAAGVAAAAVGTVGVAWVTAVKAALVASSLDLGVWSHPQFGPDCVVVRAGHISPVTTIVSRDLVWDTQRRRAIPGI